MRNRKQRHRRWETGEEHDPLAGLVNLFDLWMVFSIALLIVFVGSSRQRPTGSPDASNRPDVSGQIALQRAQALPRFRVSQEKLEGSGEKLGTAYRLASGEVVCVPDSGDGR